MRDMNDNLISTVILRCSTFISIILSTAPGLTTVGDSICSGTFNAQNQVSSQKVIQPFSPIVYMVCISVLILMASVKIWQWKISTVEPTVNSNVVQRPKDMESTLLGVILVMLLFLNYIGTMYSWR